MTWGPVRETIGVFQDEPSLGAAVDDPLTSGFDRSEISVPVAGKFGTATDHAAVWAFEPEAPLAAYVGNNARTQAKSAIVAGLGDLGTMGRLADRRAVRAE